MNQAVFQEGRAAFKLRGYGAENPYRKEIARIQAATGKDADSRLYELAADWDSGAVSAYPSPFQ